MYSHVCSSCYLMKRQASLSLWITIPASRRRTEEEEVLEQSAGIFYRWKTCATYEPLVRKCVKPYPNEYWWVKIFFLALGARNLLPQTTTPAAAPATGLRPQNCLQRCLAFSVFDFWGFCSIIPSVARIARPHLDYWTCATVSTLRSLLLAGTNFNCFAKWWI